MTDTQTAREVLDCPMGENDADAETIGEYLVKLLETLWDEDEGFSGKRPFGNSGWQGDFDKTLIQAGFVAGSLDEYGSVGEVDGAAVDDLIRAAIAALYTHPRDREAL